MRLITREYGSCLSKSYAVIVSFFLGGGVALKSSCATASNVYLCMWLALT